MTTHDNDVDRQCADYHCLETEITTLKQQRDDLLEAMTSTQNILEDIHFRHSNKKSFHNNRIAADSSTGIEILKAAIAKCEA